MPLPESEPAIPATARSQTYALERAATGIGSAICQSLEEWFSLGGTPIRWSYCIIYCTRRPYSCSVNLTD
jgi:hypothetical protein